MRGIHHSHDYVVLIVITAIIGWVYLSFSEIFEIRDRLTKVHPDPKLPPWSDLKIMFTAAFLTMVMRHVFKWLLETNIDARYKPYNLTDHEMRVGKTLDMSYGIFYYGCTSCFAYFTYWGSPNLPW